MTIDEDTNLSHSQPPRRGDTSQEPARKGLRSRQAFGATPLDPTPPGSGLSMQLPERRLLILDRYSIKSHHIMSIMQVVKEGVGMPKAKPIIGIYVRVSTSDQTTEVQESELTR
jgi:hypothetical protein